MSSDFTEDERSFLLPVNDGRSGENVGVTVTGEGGRNSYNNKYIIGEWAGRMLHQLIASYMCVMNHSAYFSRSLTLLVLSYIFRLLTCPLDFLSGLMSVFSLVATIAILTPAHRNEMRYSVAP